MLKLVSLSSPWNIHFMMVKAFLAGDPELTVSDELTEVTEGCYNFNIMSSNAVKLEGLRKVLRTNITFGNVILRMTFLVTNTAKQLEESGPVIPTVQDWEDAFTGNKYFDSIVTSGKGMFSFTYAVFAHDIVDYYADDLTDLCGFQHKLPADVVKEICRFVEDGPEISICTQTPRDLETKELF